jgi:hypothetical protein
VRRGSSARSHQGCRPSVTGCRRSSRR